jgi:hypothetical protein
LSTDNGFSSTTIITRFHYPKNSKGWDWRYQFYSNEVLPRILAQTDNNFDIWIWCEPWQNDSLKSLSNRISTFTGQWDYQNSSLFSDFTDYSKLNGLPKYQIQIGLDSDDLIEPGFIEHVHELCHGNKSIFVSFQPYKLDIVSNKKYKFNPMNRYEKINRGSPIFAFYQPVLNDNFKFAYHASHLKMPQYASKHIFEPEGLVSMGIHHLNDSTRIWPGDILCE